MGERLDQARAVFEEHRAAQQQETPPAASLFDAIVEREQAIDAVEDSYRGELIEALDEALGRLAVERQEFTVDDLHDELEGSDITTGVDMRVLGAVLRRAARRKVIRSAGFVPSRRRHASPVRLWESQVWDGA